jgi:hypothetical protein
LSDVLFNLLFNALGSAERAAMTGRMQSHSPLSPCFLFDVLYREALEHWCLSQYPPPPVKVRLNDRCFYFD